MRVRAWVVPLAALALAGCETGDMTVATPIVPVEFVYRQLAPAPGVSIASAAAAACVREVGRPHLVPRWGQSAPVLLEADGPARFRADVSDVPADQEVVVTVHDAVMCSVEPGGGGAVTRELSANGVRLTRVVEVASGTTRVPGLAFRVTARGVVVAQ